MALDRPSHFSHKMFLLVIPEAVSEKDFEVGRLCSYVVTCDPRGRANFDSRALYEHTWSRSTRRCYIPNIKALCQQVSEKNFEICLICSYILTCDPWGGASFDPHGHHMNKLRRGLHGDSAH